MAELPVLIQMLSSPAGPASDRRYFSVIARSTSGNLTGGRRTDCWWFGVCLLCSENSLWMSQAPALGPSCLVFALSTHPNAALAPLAPQTTLAMVASLSQCHTKRTAFGQGC